MQAQHQSSSDPKVTTSPGEVTQAARHLMAIRIVGTALFDYQVQKSADARIRLESVTNMAQMLGDLAPHEAALVSELLAKPVNAGAFI
ncbi:hypothetical protein [Pseudomonas corrugata]|uniref:hypothetical protein n=1 Tax=Pseudomonas corrugata TaxID=47879 RepID=UPI0028C507E9|nr:hypothetical protein [Pseudomonas corrugata]MDU9024260.1 hypothetical protein [Pseudomonas corrugata]